MAHFLTDTLNKAFGRSRPQKRGPTTKVVAFDSDGETEIVKGRNRLWSVTLNGRTYSNSRLGDLIEQVERLGYTVERRAL